LLIISTFEHSIEVEQALAVIEKLGIESASIMTVMMDNNEEQSDNGMTNHPNKKTLGFEVGMACATGLSVLGISFGFITRWGPIIWGLIAAICGFILGYSLTQLLQSNHFKQVLKKKERLPELAVIIKCKESHYPDVRRVLREYRALSVGTIQAS
jgi:hypothetical protein